MKLILTFRRNIQAYYFRIRLNHSASFTAGFEYQTVKTTQQKSMTKVLSYIIDQYVNAIISMLKDTSFQTETVEYLWIGEKDSKRI